MVKLNTVVSFNHKLLLLSLPRALEDLKAILFLSVYAGEKIRKTEPQGRLKRYLSSASVIWILGGPHHINC